MNIHVTSPDPQECARNLDNVRVNKMLTENVQMLCTAWWVINHPNAKNYAEIAPDIMKPSHRSHPCNVWVRECRENVEWMIDYTHALYAEYCKRYGPKNHKAHDKLTVLLTKYNLLDCVPSKGERTAFVNCAASKAHGVDYTHMEDVYTAYALYLSDRWELDKREPSWECKNVG